MDSASERIIARCADNGHDPYTVPTRIVDIDTRWSDDETGVWVDFEVTLRVNDTIEVVSAHAVNAGADLRFPADKCWSFQIGNRVQLPRHLDGLFHYLYDQPNSQFSEQVHRAALDELQTESWRTRRG